MNTPNQVAPDPDSNAPGAKPAGGAVSTSHSRALLTVFGHLPFTALLYCLLASVCAVALGNDENRSELLLWTVFGICVTLIQCSTAHKFDRQTHSGGEKMWWQAYYVLSWLGGLHGAYLCIALFPGDTGQQLVLILFVMATLAINLSLNAVSPLAFATYAFPTGVALAAQLAMSGQSYAMLGASMVLLTIIAAQRGCYELNRLIKSHLMLARVSQQGASHTASLVGHAELMRRAQTLASHPGLTGEGVALLRLDLAQIAQVREKRGPAEADRLLHLVSISVRRSLRAADTLARSEDDGFQVLLTPCSAAISKVVADKLIDTVRKMELKNPVSDDKVSACVGIAFSGDGRFTPKAFIELASQQCALAKQSGLHARSFAAVESDEEEDESDGAKVF
ncbi:MAG: GGDEF domain-containing protein [Burkholderiaceae bacterium]